MGDEMIKFENIEVYGWEHAMRGMRNPLESWVQGDTLSQTVGPNDLDLAMRLSKAGSDHAKYLRMIVVYMDITAPRYFHHQLDTYKVGTVKNSCSTMHTIHKRKFTEDDFATKYVHLSYVVKKLNDCRDIYLVAKHTDDKELMEYSWQDLIDILPQSYIQKFTWMTNYEVLKNIYHSRRNHKLQEWRDFCKMIEALPYSQLITLKEGESHPQD